MQALVSAPNQFKGRLSELLSQMRMQRYQWNNVHATEYTLDKGNKKKNQYKMNFNYKNLSHLQIHPKK